MYPMSELDYSKGEMEGYYSEASAYFQKNADDYRNSGTGELQQRKDKFASLIASGSPEDRVKAMEMLSDDKNRRLDAWLNQVTADHLDPHKHSLPGSEIVAFLLVKEEYPHIRFSAEDKGISRYESPDEKVKNQSLAKAFAACISDMNRKYPAGSQVAKALEWVNHGGLANVVQAAVNKIQ